MGYLSLKFSRLPAFPVSLKRFNAAAGGYSSRNHLTLPSSTYDTLHTPRLPNIFWSHQGGFEVMACKYFTILCLYDSTSSPGLPLNICLRLYMPISTFDQLNTTSPAVSNLLERVFLQDAAYAGFALHAPNSNLCATLVCYPTHSFSSTSSPESILPSNFLDYSISVKFLEPLGLLSGSPAVCTAANNALSYCGISSLSNANVLMP